MKKRLSKRCFSLFCEVHIKGNLNWSLDHCSLCSSESVWIFVAMLVSGTVMFQADIERAYSWCWAPAEKLQIFHHHILNTQPFLHLFKTTNTTDMKSDLVASDLKSVCPLWHVNNCLGCSRHTYFRLLPNVLPDFNIGPEEHCEWVWGVCLGVVRNVGNRY